MKRPIFFAVILALSISIPTPVIRAQAASVIPFPTCYPMVAAGSQHTLGLKDDGTVLATGDNNFGECEVGDWKDIVSIAACGDVSVGLKSNGEVLAIGANYDKQCDVSGWHEIVSVSTSGDHTVGLKSNGTVVATGNNFRGCCDVSSWSDIIAIAAGAYHTVGLKSDGTVVAAGDLRDGCDVGSWTSIITVGAGSGCTFGIKSDGSVVAVGDNGRGESDVIGWNNIKDISSQFQFTVGLKNDGTVVFAGSNDYGQGEVGNWSNIISITAGGGHTVGLKSDGTVLAIGNNEDGTENSEWVTGQCNVDKWNLITGVQPLMPTPTTGAAVKNAIYILPGVAGSELADGTEVIWGGDKDHMQSMLLRWVPDLTCNSSGIPQNSNIEAYDNPESEEHGALDYYGPLVNALKNTEFLGATNYTDVIYSPYDWRLSIDRNAKLLEEEITGKNYGKVTFVAHSMGGLVATKCIDYLEKHSKSSMIGKLITIGTPYLGSPKMLYVMETGELFGKYEINNLAVFIQLQILAPNFPGVYGLFPPSQYFDFNNTYYVGSKSYDVFTARYWKNPPITNYTDTIKMLYARNWSRDENNIEKPFLYNAQSFYDSIYINNEPMVNRFDSYFIIGYGKDTIGEVDYDNTSNQYSNVLDVQNITGDGTVPVISANIGGRVPENKSFYIKEGHSELPKNGDVIELIKAIIENTNPDASAISFAPTITHDLPTQFLGWQYKLKINCPVDVTIKKDGETVCSITSDETSYSDSCCTVYRLGKDYDKKIVYLDASQQYDIYLSGTAEGKMDYSICQVSDEGKEGMEIQYTNVPVTAQTHISTVSNVSEQSVLSVDNNNDGMIDFSVKPKVVDPSASQTSGNINSDQSTKLSPVIILLVAVIIIVFSGSIFILFVNRKRKR